MEAVAKRNIDNYQQIPARKKPGNFWLIVGVIFLILMFVPDPLKFVPIIGEGEELLEGGISMSAFLIFFVRRWLYRNIKEHVNYHTQK